MSLVCALNASSPNFLSGYNYLVVASRLVQPSKLSIDGDDRPLETSLNAPYLMHTTGTASRVLTLATRVARLDTLETYEPALIYHLFEIPVFPPISRIVRSRRAKARRVNILTFATAPQLDFEETDGGDDVTT